MSANKFEWPIRGRFRNMHQTAVLLFLFCLPLFLHLGKKPLREWDEARNAINAYEMTKTGEWLVKTFNYEPDLWETKPPLLVWLQAAGFKLFGYEELAVRLPSALALLALTIYLVVWFRNKMHRAGAGILSAFVLLSSQGIIHEHAGRTGDHDAMLVCFSTIMLLSFFAFTEHKALKNILMCCFWLILGIYTKSIAALMMLPGMLLYTAISGKFISLFKDYKIYLAALAVAVSVGLYYWARELKGPGYLEAVWHNELFPRYSNSSDRYQYNVSGFWYYFLELKDWQFSYWGLPFVISVVWNFVCLKGKAFRLHLFLVCNALCFFLIISSGTSNYWYDLPLIPLCAMVIGLAVQSALVKLKRLAGHMPGRLFRIAAISAIGILIAWPYSKVISKVLNDHEHNQQVMYGYAFKSINKSYPLIKELCVFDPLGYNYPLVFYSKVYTDKGYTIKNIYPSDSLSESTSIILLDEQYDAFLKLGIPHKTLIKDKLYRVIMTEQ